MGGRDSVDAGDATSWMEGDRSCWSVSGVLWRSGTSGAASSIVADPSNGDPVIRVASGSPDRGASASLLPYTIKRFVTIVCPAAVEISGWRGVLDSGTAVTSSVSVL